MARRPDFQSDNTGSIPVGGSNLKEDKMQSWEDIARKFAELLYDCIHGDMDDPSESFYLMEDCGFVDDNQEWIYND